jgi:hypothetical protein
LQYVFPYSTHSYEIAILLPQEKQDHAGDRHNLEIAHRNVIQDRMPDQICQERQPHKKKKVRVDQGVPTHTAVIFAQQVKTIKIDPPDTANHDESGDGRHHIVITPLNVR